MAKLVALYKKPADAAAFDAYYFGTHVPIAKKVPDCDAGEYRPSNRAAGQVALPPRGNSEF